MTLASFFLHLLIVALFIWGVRSLLIGFSVPDPMKTVIEVAAVVLSILWLIARMGMTVPSLVPGR